MTELVQLIIDALALGSFYALIALGIALIYGIMGLVNFAHGEIIAVGAYAGLAVSGSPLAVLVIAFVVTTVLVALAMDRAAFRPVRDASPTTLLITSFAVSYLVQSVLTMVYTSTPRAVTLPDIFIQSVQIGSIHVSNVNLIVMGTTAILLSALAVFFRRTQLGIRMRAASEDFLMARLLGVRANVMIATAFAISGLLAGIAGVIFVAQTGTVTPTLGVNLTVIGFVAIVIGGMNSFVAAALGAFTLGAVTVGLQKWLPVGLLPFREAFVFTAVIGILLFRPSGIFSRRAGQVRV